MNPTDQTKTKASAARRWIRRGFLVWAVVSTLWMANSVRTQGVDDKILQSSATVLVEDGPAVLEFRPALTPQAALVFICGSGIAAQAYAPLLRPIADAGYAVFVIKLPYRFAPMESHKQEAVERGRQVVAQHPAITRWVLAGHSLGGALACRTVQVAPKTFAAMVLVGTTHPKNDDLSGLSIPVIKVYGTNDGVAPIEKIMANRNLLPADTKWVEIAGGNHSQFGHYGQQLFDGTATISRDAQQTITRTALLAALSEAGK